MAFEVMKEILQAEQQAEEILKQASVEKETMKAEAAEKSSNMIAEAKKMAKQASQQKIEKAITRRKPKGAAHKIKQTAQTRLEEAADAVIRKVVG